MGNGTKVLYRQSGVIPFRRRGAAIEILLITSRSGKRWVVPKGSVEPDLTPAESGADICALAPVGAVPTVAVKLAEEMSYSSGLLNICPNS